MQKHVGNLLFHDAVFVQKNDESQGYYMTDPGRVPARIVVNGLLRMMRPVLLCMPLLLAACGGGGGDASGKSGAAAGGPVAYMPGVYRPFAELADYCATPRKGFNPYTGRFYSDRQGSVAMENNFLRSWMNDTYLWYADLSDIDPNSYGSPEDYFAELRSWEVDEFGYAKDRYHGALPTEEVERAEYASEEYGYGIYLKADATTPPRDYRVAYVMPGSPAELAGITRGDQFLEVDGVNLVTDESSAGLDVLAAGLFPAALGETHDFLLQKNNGSQIEVTLSSSTVVNPPVLKTAVLATGTGKVGYIQFNDHAVLAEKALANAVSSLRASAVTDLVLDLRYNGGGYLAIASQMAYMVAGNSRTAGKTFYRQIFNDKHPHDDPVTGEANRPFPFLAQGLGFSLTEGQALPSLNLSRVYVLTSASTCSASEAIINGLRGIDVEVIQIGGTTCGKPYGFYPEDNCGTTYFAVQMKGVNAKGFGDYHYGLSPANSTFAPGVKGPGCVVEDDLSHELGDVNEDLLATALAYRTHGAAACPAVPAPMMARSARRAVKGPALEHRNLKTELRNGRMLWVP